MGAPTATRQLSVLWIDDDPDVVKYSATLLAREGHLVDWAEGGRRGLRLTETKPYDVIVLDYKLPDLPGAEVLTRLRSRDQRTPVLVLTGFGTESVAREAGEGGATSYYEKPLIGAHLLQALHFAIYSANRLCSPVADDPPPQRHAYSRWAEAVAAILDSPTDPRTVEQWARHLNMSEGALRNWCRAAGITPHRSLLLGRALRAALQARIRGGKPEDYLDIIDRRSSTNFIESAGLLDWTNEDLDSFLERQGLVRLPEALHALRTSLSLRRVRES